ncbi:hypothetical protein EJ06DRAFT_547462 [Trichodelitschia bisporula]|uniref:DNA-directed RNA polymerase III subunit RPC6 n=1 Tax=Trichodelitschia bisporula TaxID=703511 RepID=A0A6G1I4H0_9PEZI|nr:hypothetical protein EJ06DRAFT_547462 [Trichodelitschia bisporula]
MSEKPAKTAAEAAALKAKWSAMYDKCVEAKPMGAYFSLEELMEFGVAMSDTELLAICEELVSCNLFAVAMAKGSLRYLTRGKELAIKITGLQTDTRVVYSHIEASGTNGMWKRSLCQKTNMHDNRVVKAIRELMAKKLIREIKSAKAQNRRIYILSHLDPSEENTGGNFFSDGAMDTGLIEALGEFILRHIETHSWAEQKVPAGHKARGVKRKRNADDVPASADIEDLPMFKVPLGPNKHPLVPFPPSHRDYPTVSTIMDLIDESGVLKDVTLQEHDVKQLLGKLEYEELVEQVPNLDGQPPGYRSTRRVWDRHPGTVDWNRPLDPADDGVGPGDGFTQVPCGRCPVFKACRPGGVVSPETCEYFEPWLKF